MFKALLNVWKVRELRNKILFTLGLLGVGVVYDFCTLNRQVDELNRGVV